MFAFLDDSYYLLLKDLAYFGVALAGVIIAGKGLYTWKKQILWKVEHETARRLYKSVLKVREALGHVRNPAIWPSESAAAEAKYPEVGKSTTKAVYYMRWEKITEAISELDLEQIEAEVLWDNEVVEKLKPLRVCVSKLNINLSDFLRPPDQKIRSHRITEDIIYEFKVGNEKDPFSKEIDDAVTVLGDFLKPKYRLSDKK